VRDSSLKSYSAGWSLPFVTGCAKGRSACRVSLIGLGCGAWAGDGSKVTEKIYGWRVRRNQGRLQKNGSNLRRWTQTIQQMIETATTTAMMTVRWFAVGTASFDVQSMI
jgi:hypothetical protein